MPSYNQKKGNKGESLARDFLEKLGFRFVAGQWHCRYGELDLIMLDRGELVFVEVKLRVNNRSGRPEEMVSYGKQEKLKRTAQSYISKHRLYDTFWRFDIVAITGNNLNYEIRHFRDSIRDD